MRSRSAFRLTGYPPNLLAYIPGSGWDMAADVEAGTEVRLEVTEDPDALAARALNFPDGKFLLPIRGLQIGDEVRFRADDEIARAGAAAARYQRLGWTASILLLLWLGWLACSWRRGLQALRLT